MTDWFKDFFGLEILLLILIHFRNIWTSKVVCKVVFIHLSVEGNKGIIKSTMQKRHTIVICNY